MVSKVLARRMINFQKDSFNRAFAVADMVQDLFEVWFSVYLEELTWLPKEGVRFNDLLIGTRKKDRRAFKNLIDRTYDSVLATINETNAPISDRKTVNTIP